MISLVNNIDSNIINYLNNISNFQISTDTFSKIYVYKKNEEIVGLINYSIIYERAELNYIYVIDKFRNIGIAQSLMNAMEKDCIKNKCRNITLEVSENNKRAINLYKKNHFNSISIRKNYYGNENAILMIREFD